MKIVYAIAVMALLTVVSAMAEQVIVAGTIYEEDGVTEVSGATVQVVCDQESESTTSDDDGDYSVDLSDTTCDAGETVIVTASKGSAVGVESDTVVDYTYINLAIVNVTIPEFGLIAGGMSFLGAAGAYIAMRRKK